MHTMLNPILRWSALIMVLGLVACGGDDDAAQCTDGEKSVPSAVGDPCPQVGTACAATALPGGGKAVACCAGTTWAQDMSGAVDCKCETATSAAVICAGGGAGAGAVAGMCGNGVINAPEQCDGNALGATLTCMAMNMGTGLLGCNPTTCTYDTTMCTGLSSTSGPGAGGSGT